LDTLRKKLFEETPPQTDLILQKQENIKPLLSSTSNTLSDIVPLKDVQTKQSTVVKKAPMDPAKATERLKTDKNIDPISIVTFDPEQGQYASPRSRPLTQQVQGTLISHVQA